jgi:hypothetical protein
MGRGCGLRLDKTGGVVEVYTHESSQVPIFKWLTEKKIRAGHDSVIYESDLEWATWNEDPRKTGYCQPRVRKTTDAT